MNLTSNIKTYQANELLAAQDFFADFSISLDDLEDAAPTPAVKFDTGPILEVMTTDSRSLKAAQLYELPGSSPETIEAPDMNQKLANLGSACPQSTVAGSGPKISDLLDRKQATESLNLKAFTPIKQPVKDKNLLNRNVTISKAGNQHPETAVKQGGGMKEPACSSERNVTVFVEGPSLQYPKLPRLGDLKEAVSGAVKTSELSLSKGSLLPATSKSQSSDSCPKNQIDKPALLFMHPAVTQPTEKNCQQTKPRSINSHYSPSSSAMPILQGTDACHKPETEKQEKLTPPSSAGIKSQQKVSIQPNRLINAAGGQSAKIVLPTAPLQMQSKADVVPNVLNWQVINNPDNDQGGKTSRRNLAPTDVSIASSTVLVTNDVMKSANHMDLNKRSQEGTSQVTEVQLPFVQQQNLDQPFSAELQPQLAPLVEGCMQNHCEGSNELAKKSQQCGSINKDVQSFPGLQLEAMQPKSNVLQPQCAAIEDGNMEPAGVDAQQTTDVQVLVRGVEEMHKEDMQGVAEACPSQSLMNKQAFIPEVAHSDQSLQHPVKRVRLFDPDDPVSEINIPPNYIAAVQALEMKIVEAQQLEDEVMELRVQAVVASNRLLLTDNPVVRDRIKATRSKAMYLQQQLIRPHEA
ncbi:hypothetical protein CEUSTIGMA_g10595.t1 [Chlamydomonas eustigma]|uniref:Uncharacterized protein n=1 Tax=Chlamydomonas eustigma TaxID=1157962 RepID=A0A250XJR9_9CHLO|nr:hypothetical protein CEUSTIGMA_g10595.t1 [Chlamydomonas eustigma]|eukprot:GAX83169.1 hypothetical protein CEUSTIGMA_g10595.t1 [Chlamydomonas eustigma]